MEQVQRPDVQRATGEIDSGGCARFDFHSSSILTLTWCPSPVSLFFRGAKAIGEKNGKVFKLTKMFKEIGSSVGTAYKIML